MLRSDFILATGIKNTEQQHGYHGLKETFDETQYPYLNWEDRYGHPSLAVPDKNYDGTVFSAGFICQRAGYLEIFLSSGRFNRSNRLAEGILPLTEAQTHIIEAYLSLKFQTPYGAQPIVFYDTAPEKQDELDSALFFTNKAFPREKPHRTYTQTSIVTAIAIATHDSGYKKAQQYIKKHIPPITPKYTYPDETCLNPGYEDIASVQRPLHLQEKRIWALRSDFILATGVKNAYEREYGYTGLKDCFGESTQAFLNWRERSGHPSLAIAENGYDGAVFYAGYICQREGYLQVYLVSGRFERSDLSQEQTQVIEAYIAAQLQVAYGVQDIVFDFGDSNVPYFHATFFGNRTFDSRNPQRRYHQSTIQAILTGMIETPDIAALATH